MAKYFLSYRNGEISAEVEAENEEEATSKFMAGKAKAVYIEYSALYPEFVDVDDVEDSGDDARESDSSEKEG